MSAMQKKNYNFIFYLKAIAIILIVNSHCDSLYPIPALATGGALGNAIFFAVSGFCLYPINMNFKEWCIKRIKRIYVPIWIVTVITVSIGLMDIDGFIGCVRTFIWPTRFWFAGAIVVYYLLYYALKDLTTKKNFVEIWIVCIALYFVYYFTLLDTSTWIVEAAGLHSIEGYFKLIYYFAAMMIGKWFAVNIESLSSLRDCRSLWLANTVFSFILVFGFKFLMNRYVVLYRAQFLNQFFVLYFVVAVFMLMVQEERYLRKFGICLRIVTFLATLTFEIYLVHGFVISSVSEIVFPINMIIAIPLILILAKLLSLIIKAIFNLRSIKEQ